MLDVKPITVYGNEEAPEGYTRVHSKCRRCKRSIHLDVNSDFPDVVEQADGNPTAICNLCVPDGKSYWVHSPTQRSIPPEVAEKTPAGWNRGIMGLWADAACTVTVHSVSKVVDGEPKIAFRIREDHYFVVNEDQVIIYSMDGDFITQFIPEVD